MDTSTGGTANEPISQADSRQRAAGEVEDNMSKVIMNCEVCGKFGSRNTWDSLEDFFEAAKNGIFEINPEFEHDECFDEFDNYTGGRDCGGKTTYKFEA